MSFHRAARKLAPLSEVTLAGTPKRATQLWRKADAAAEAVASFIGVAWIILVVRQIEVRMYL